MRTFSRIADENVRTFHVLQHIAHTKNVNLINFFRYLLPNPIKTTNFVADSTEEHKKKRLRMSDMRLLSNAATREGDSKPTSVRLAPETLPEAKAHKQECR